MGKKGKEAKRREKKQRTGKKHLSLKPHDYYEVSGDSANRKRRNCPRCGPGTWLGNHKGRLYCGKCGYTEFERRPPAAPSRAQEDRQSDQPSPRDASNPPQGESPRTPEKPSSGKPAPETQAPQQPAQ